jgi:hypothetical protein
MAAGRGSDTKPPLERIAVFGANGHIGRPLAEWITANSATTGLKLVIRNEDHHAALAAAFPHAEICIANYYDLASLESALFGVQGAFIVTPDFLDEQRAMTNFVYAARTNPGLRHVVRLIADPPGMTAEGVPDSLKAFGGGTAVQHLRERRSWRRAACRSPTSTLQPTSCRIS